MGRKDLLQMSFGAAVLVTVSFTGAAQTQNQTTQTQNQPQTQTTQGQTQTQAQPTQPPQKQSFWQKMKASAMQGAQNSVQQGSQQVQNGVQGATQGVQQGVNGATQGMQQGVQGATQGMQQGGQQMVNGANPMNASFSGSGGGSSCGQSCFNAGPFQANVQQMTMSQQGAWHIIRMNIQFHNSTNQPLIIAYKEGSMVMVDNNGNTYVPAGGNPGELQGMGVDRGSQTDSQFQLGPGQTGNAMFSVARIRPDTSPVGTAYQYNLTIDELQAQNGAMAVAVRSYNMNFPSLSAGISNTGFGSGSQVAGGALPAGSSSYVAPAAGTKAAAVGAAATPTTAGTVNNAAMKSSTGAAAQKVVVVRPIPATASTAKPAVVVKTIPATTKTTTAKPATTATPSTTTTTNKN
ncbi:MAG TPA: hypothetical protein VFB28_08825 [Terriglobales bacterium]|nr:hypothetical protein [Terriglobales bacterium]